MDEMLEQWTKGQSGELTHACMSIRKSFSVQNA
jgi:hypothetical protein